MQKTILIGGLIFGIIIIILLLYLFMFQGKSAVSSITSITVGLIAFHNSTPIDQAVYTYNGSTFTCIRNTQQLSGAYSCFVINQSQEENFTTTFNIRVGNTTNSTIDQKFFFSNLTYSSGTLHLTVIALTNITNTSLLLLNNRISNYSYNGTTIVHSNLKDNFSVGGSYNISFKVKKDFLQYEPELCIDRDCQMLSCVIIKDYLTTYYQNLNPLNATSLIGGIGFYCDNPYDGWSSALSWMNSNVGPNGPKVLSWWDYGDWISWYGNSNPVVVSANPNPQADYDVAAQYVLNSSAKHQSLSSFMENVHAKYIVFDSALLEKWLALDFLACVDINQTSLSYAVAQGQQFGTAFELGFSGCEHKNGPIKVFVPTVNLQGSFCNANSYKVLLFKNQQLGNQTFCVSTNLFTSANPSEYLYTQNGTNTNVLLNSTLMLPYRTLQVNGQLYLDMLAIVTKNSSLGFSISNLTQFYNSTYYHAFILGKLSGFKQVYPDYVNGTNYVNYYQPVRIYELLNYTG